MTEEPRSQRRAIPASWLTPRPGRTVPVHRWFVFPHSFAPQLVDWLIGELNLRRGATVLDPFCGAGTTLVEAQRLGFAPVGVDLLPLAKLATDAKVRPPSKRALRRAREAGLAAARSAGRRTPPSTLLKRAFTPTAFGRLSAVLDSTEGPAAQCVRLATLSAAPRFASLVADGGWLRETSPLFQPRVIPDAIEEALVRVEADLDAVGPPRPHARVHLGDARRLRLRDNSVDAVVTSPPYPNRHDYTRVFGIELELGFGLGESVKRLRYRAVRSHPEARAVWEHNGYAPTTKLTNEIKLVAARHPDPRIPRMLGGYFADLYIVLRELHRVLRCNGSVALVVGNAQYSGIEVPVDSHVAQLAERAGYSVREIVPLRARGNSAQQMAEFGRRPSRESAVLLRRIGS